MRGFPPNPTEMRRGCGRRREPGPSSGAGEIEDTASSLACCGKRTCLSSHGKVGQKHALLSSGARLCSLLSNSTWILQPGSFSSACLRSRFLPGAPSLTGPRPPWDGRGGPALGQRYAFAFRKGRTTDGASAISMSRPGSGSGIGDGDHPIWVTIGLVKQFLAPYGVVAVRDVRSEPPFHESAGGS